MKKTGKIIKLALFLWIVFFYCGVTPTFAHKVTVFAWEEGGKIYTESRFSGGKKVKNGRIDVYDDSGKKIMEGRTDDQGLFVFENQGATGLDIVLKAGAGHQARWNIANDELTNETEAGKADKENTARPEKPETVEGGRIHTEELEAVVEKVLDRKLRPVIAMMRDQQSRDPSMTDIIGGIGYIFGLAGMAAWFSAKKKKGGQDNG